MTRVTTRRTAVVVLGDGSHISVEAEYESSGELNCLFLKQVAEADDTHIVVVAELKYVEQIVNAIRAVMPGGQP